MKPLHVLVTGANGQLGNEMRIIAKSSQDNYIFTDVLDASDESITILHKLAGDSVDIRTIKLDITNIDAIRAIVKDNGVNVIVNCAAYTNVDAAEDNYELAELLNAKAPESLAIAMKEVNGLLVHISTDYVFGKEPYNTPCKEDQKGTPTGVYGLTKLHGEENIKASGCNYVIIRTAWLYSEFGKNFVKTMLNLIATKPELKVVFDQVGTPTYALDLANAIGIIIGTYKEEFQSYNPPPTTYYSKTGVYHFSNEGVCSWFDFSMMIKTINAEINKSRLASTSKNSDCIICPCHSDELDCKVIRPSFSVLDKSKIKHIPGLIVPYWTESLYKCINNIRDNK